MILEYDNRFKQLVSDSCIIFIHEPHQKFVVIICIHVDDIVLLCNSQTYVTTMCKALGKQLKERGGDMTDLGRCNHYCGVKIKDMGEEIQLSVNKYMRNIIDSFGEGIAIKHAPYPSGQRIVRGTDVTKSKVPDNALSIPSFVGSLRFASRIDPRGLFVCTALGPAQAKATPEGVEVCKHHVGYIKGHGHAHLSFRGHPKDPTVVEIQGYCDIAFGVFEGRSIGSSIVTINGNMSLATSKWIDRVCHSTTEAEMVQLSKLARDVLFYANIFKEMEIEFHKPMTCGVTTSPQFSRRRITQ